MRKLLMAFVVLGLLSASAAAQDAPKAEIFGGYSYLRLNGGTNISGGWHASIAGNFNNYFGLVGEFSGHYKDLGPGTSVKVHTFTFGPRLTHRSTEQIDAFTHVTFGGARTSASALGISASDTAFALTLGGGIDVRVTERVAIRPVQLDYVMTRFGGATQSNLRYSAGIVFRFSK